MRAALPWFVIVNPAAGGGRARRRWPALRAALKHAGLPIRWVETTRAGEAGQLAADAVAAGERQLLVVGGDGSLHEVVNGLYAQDAAPLEQVVVAAAPCGSGNDWARTMGFPAAP